MNLSIRQFVTLKALQWTGLVNKQQLNSVDSSPRAWFRIIESFPGAWQQNTEIELANVLTYSAVYACVTLIASDVGKLRIKLVQEEDTPNGAVWSETKNPAFTPVLRKPNRYQTRQQFLGNWMTQKLIYGNAYVLKQRDRRQVVTALYVLDANRVRPLVATDGSVFYEIQRDDLATVPERILVPSSEMIHDRNEPLYHPLVGVSPIHACGLAATQGLKILDNSTTFFDNGSQPGGFLTAPGTISDETAARLKAYFDENFSGANRGKVAVGGDGLKYEPLAMSATDAQLIEQLKWTAEDVCRAFHVPPYKIAVGPPPNYNNIEALNLEYYEQCLQTHIEGIEALLDEALGLTDSALGTELDIDNLMRMDTQTLITTQKEAVVGGLKSPNEARQRLNLKPAKGGDSPMLQQQNFSLEALAERDSDKPFAKPAPALPATPAAPEETPEDVAEERSINRARLLLKAQEFLRAA